MKKLLSAAAVGVMLLLSGCAQMQMPEGYDAIKEAKAKYETLDSARTVMTDLSTGEVIMEFSFFFNKNDEMVLNYYGKDGDDEMYAYSNGAEYFYKEPGDEMWSVIPTGDESYIYNLYNREYRYPYAQGGIFFLDGTSVDTAAVEWADDGSCVVTYTYDAEKLSRSTQGRLDGVDSFSALTTTFEINPDGYIMAFTEEGTLIDSEGATRDVNMKITVESMNEVYDIPYPVDQLDK